MSRNLLYVSQYCAATVMLLLLAAYSGDADLTTVMTTLTNHISDAPQTPAASTITASR